MLHNIAAAEYLKLLAKGTRLTEAQGALLRAAGHEHVAVVVLEAGDIHEDEAACMTGAQALWRTRSR